jgi:hypothetical protein
MYIKMRCMILCTLSSLPTVFSFFMRFTWNAVGVILEKIFVVGSSGKKKRNSSMSDKVHGCFCLEPDGRWIRKKWQASAMHIRRIVASCYIGCNMQSTIRRRQK